MRAENRSALFLIPFLGLETIMDGTSAPPAATSETDRYRRKRASIVAAASDIINHKGVKGTTLADVAASVGLITTSVTYYFKKKEDLAEACFQDAIDRLDALITEALSLIHI